MSSRSNALAPYGNIAGQTPPAIPAVGAGPAQLTRRQKAAIIVQFILKEGADVPLTALPADLQASLTRQMGVMRYVDRGTLNAVIAEFAEELDGVGLTFAGDIGRTLDQLDGKISPQTARRLRKEAGVRQMGDPWDRLRGLEVEEITAIIASESVEIGAVILSKIEVDKAAKVLAQVPGEQARRLAYAVSMTTKVTPDAVDRIGLSLAAQLDSIPDKAFDEPAVDRVGAILNISRSATRDDVLTGLDETDEDFAKAVRRAIFTFGHIHMRVKELDVPAVLRAVDQDILIRAMAAASNEDDEKSREFILSNISQRMAGSIREGIEEVGKVPEEEGEEAKTEVVLAIRLLVESGDIKLKKPEDAET